MSQAISKRWTTDPQYTKLLNYLITKTKDMKPPIYIRQLAREFKRISGAALTERCLKSRIDKMRAIIHSFEHIETDTKVRMLFVLSVPVNGDFLQELHNDAHVEVDEQNRITVYKSERLELKGYHGLSMRGDTKNYWETDPEYIDLLNLLIERTKNVKSPMSLAQLARDFKEKSGTALTEEGLKSRIKSMCKVIHSFDHIDTETKVRMLFALSVPVNRDFLQEMSNDAHVEVDEDNRIAHYKSERLVLKGYHRLSTAYDTKPYWLSDSEGIDLLNYLIEATENVKSPMNLLQLARDFKEKRGTFQTAESIAQRIIQVRGLIHNFEHIDTNTKVKLLFALSGPVNVNFLKELRERAFVKVDNMNRITYYKAINNGLELRLDFSLAARLKTVHHESKRSRWSMSDFENKDDVVPKTGDEKKLGPVDFITKSPLTFETPTSSKRKADIWVSSSSKRSLSSPDNDSFHSFDDPPKFELTPFCGEIQEDLNGIVDDKDIQQIPKPMETPIKVEVEEPLEVKPETSHNSKTQLFEAMQSLIVYLGTPCLSQIQSEIHQKIQKIGLNEVILNTEIVLTIRVPCRRSVTDIPPIAIGKVKKNADRHDFYRQHFFVSSGKNCRKPCRHGTLLTIELLIARIIDHSVVNLSETAESVNLSNFLCYLKASILNSKLSGVEGFLRNISKLIEESPDKRIPIEKFANAFRATLDDVDF
ncbi:unnamed protein product [Caenorhabditis brenneri]